MQSLNYIFCEVPLVRLMLIMGMRTNSFSFNFQELRPWRCTHCAYASNDRGNLKKTFIEYTQVTGKNNISTNLIHIFKINGTVNIRQNFGL